MSKPTIYGFPQSSFVWTARAVAIHKGIDHDFFMMTPGDHKQSDHLERHPYGKVPGFSHGDVQLWETTAIARYLDEAFDGPSLQGRTAVERAQVDQWSSMVNSYFYPEVVLGFLFPVQKGTLDESGMADITTRIRHSLDQIEQAVGTGTWLVGDQLSLADYFVGPMLFVLAMLEPGRAILADYPNVGRLMEALQTSPSHLMAAAPPQ